MFPTYQIDNDLKAVDDTIRKFWELDIPFDCNGEIADAHDKALDDAGGKLPIETPEKSSRGRRSAETADAAPTRRSRRTETPAETADETPAEQVEETPRRGRRKLDADAPAETPVEDSGSSTEDAPKRYTRRHRD